MKKIVVILVVVGIVVGVVFLARGNRAAAPVEPKTETAKVTRGDIELYVEATGSIESNLDVAIKSKASGEIISLPYDVSDRVVRHVEGKNDDKALLAALDPIDESRRVDRAQAARDAAKASLDQARQTVAIAKEKLRVTRLEADAGIAAAEAQAELDRLSLNRVKELFDRKACTQNELDIAAASARISVARLATAKAAREVLTGLELTVRQREAEEALAAARLAGADSELADARQRLAETKVYSPIDGVVTKRDVQIGQIISSGIINVAGGTTLMTVSDLSRIFVEAAVDESDIGRLIETKKLGQEVTITTDAYTSRAFKGKVVRISPRGETEASVVRFAVKIEVFGEDKDLLLPKMTANVRILAGRRKNVPLIPAAAVRYEKSQSFVLVRRGGQFKSQAVRLGLHDGERAEVLEGLSDGEEVAVSGGVVTRWRNAGGAGEDRPKGK